MNSKRLMALLIKSGGNRFDLPVIKSCCVSLSANDFIMRMSVNCHVTGVNYHFQIPPERPTAPFTKGHNRRAALEKTSASLNALRVQSAFLLWPVKRDVRQLAIRQAEYIGCHNLEIERSYA